MRVEEWAARLLTHISYTSLPVSLQAPLSEVKVEICLRKAKEVETAYFLALKKKCKGLMDPRNRTLDHATKSLDC